MNRQLFILLMVATLVPVSFISAPYPDELVLQHVPTIAALITLAMAIHFLQISSVSFACLISPPAELRQRFVK